jgi:hypothetical protein
LDAHVANAGELDHAASKTMSNRMELSIPHLQARHQRGAAFVRCSLCAESKDDFPIARP